MDLFKSQLLQEAPRHVAGPYRQSFARRYGRRGDRRTAFDLADGPAGNDDADFHAEREILRRMADYDLAA